MQDFLIRKILAVLCITISMVLGGFLIYISYRVSQFQTDTKLATLVFIPTFIVIYWLGLLHDHLVIRKKTALFKKGTRRLMKAVYFINMIAVIAVWIYVLYNYTYFFGNLLSRNLMGGGPLW